MQLQYIGIQSCRYNDTALNCSKFIVLRESRCFINAVSDHCRDQLQDLCLGNRCFDHRENLIHDIKDCGKAGFFCLVNDHLDNSSLSLCTSHIQACRITDTAVGSSLYTIQMIGSDNRFLIFRLRLRQLYRCITLASLFRSFHAVVVHMNDLRIGKRDIQSSQTVYYCYQCVKINGYVICNIKIQVCVQHINCLCRSAKGICCIGFGIGIIFHIEKCVSVNRYQLDCLRVVVDTCNDDGITVLCVQLLIPASVVQSKQCICGITRHLRCLVIGYDILFLKICFLNIDLVQLG